MRRFVDGEGTAWVASVRERSGDDYKGRYSFVLTREDGGSRGEVELADIRWNRRETAERTLETMSVWELRRKLRSARGRAA
jgi:hypothetical protein